MRVRKRVIIMQCNESQREGHYNAMQCNAVREQNNKSATISTLGNDNDGTSRSTLQRERKNMHK